MPYLFSRTITAHFLKVLVLIAFGNRSAAQLSVAEKKAFISTYYETRYKKQEKLVFVGGLDPSTKQDIIKSLTETRTLRKVDDIRRTTDSFAFSPEEKKFLSDEIEKQMDGTHWKEWLPANASTISIDTIRAIVQDPQRGWYYLSRHYSNWLHRASIPIFFRNRTLCAFYEDYNCGELCGQGKFGIYRKRDGRWELWFTIYDWIT